MGNGGVPVCPAYRDHRALVDVCLSNRLDSMAATFVALT
jgi:hypothetical protein